LVGLTVKEGLFSEWNGHRPDEVGAGLLQLHGAADDLDHVGTREQLLDE
jgi:hypothetical protein